MTSSLDSAAIIALARKAYEDAINAFPQGCDEDQMRAFLMEHSPYPFISWHIAMGNTDKVTELVALALKK